MTETGSAWRATQGVRKVKYSVKVCLGLFSKVCTNRTAVDGAVEELACPEGVTALPVGTESTLEADGGGPCLASLGSRKKKIEATLDTIVAEVRQLAAATAVLGAKLVGSDVYARARELVLLVMTGDRPLSELMDLLRLGYNRAQAVRALQVAVRCRLRRSHGPNREQ